MGDDGGKSPQEGIGDVVQALQRSFPQYVRAIAQMYPELAGAEYNIAKEYTPKYAQIQADTLDNQGRQLAKIGRELSSEELKSAADTEADIAEGSGQRIAAAGVKAQREADPEYYASRTKVADAIGKYLDFSPDSLSKGEEEEIARGLGRTGTFVPSANETLKNAAVFGKAGADRRTQYGNAISTAANATSALRGGVDAAGLTGRRTVMPNVGTGSMPGIVTPGVGSTNAMGGQLTGTATAAMGINMQKEKSDWEKYMAGLQAVDGTIGTVGKVAAMVGCWVARAVYGEADPRWLIFRTWLYRKAPTWLFILYHKHGEWFSYYVKRYPWLRKFIKSLMDPIVNNPENKTLSVLL